MQSPRDSRSAGPAPGDATEPPFIKDLAPDNIHVLRGKNFQLKAEFAGEPAPTVRWFRQKHELKPGQWGPPTQERTVRARYPGLFLEEVLAVFVKQKSD